MVENRVVLCRATVSYRAALSAVKVRAVVSVRATLFSYSLGVVQGRIICGGRKGRENY